MTLTETAADRKRHGKHYTPKELAQFLARRGVSALTPTGDTIEVLDPACGDGELLFAAFEELRSEYPTRRVALTGYDIDPIAVEVAQSRADALGINVTLLVADFLAMGTKHAQSFDLIITNPPYVRTQQLGGAAAAVLAEKFGLTGRIDLTHPFVSIAPTALKVGGVLALLCSNRFLTTKAGANVRQVLMTRLNVRELFDLGDTKMFTAAVLPAIVIAQSGGGETVPRYASAYETAASETGVAPVLDALTGGEDSVGNFDDRQFSVKVGTLIAGEGPTGPWRMGGTCEEDWFNEVDRATWRRFGEIAKIRVGIKTTADSVFISSTWDDVAPELRPEDELLLPLITHFVTEPWVVGRNAAKVLYPYDLDHPKRRTVDLTEYPRTAAFLESHRERLSSRKYVIEGGREWWEIWVPQKPDLWKLPKIVFPDISENARFGLDRTGAVVNGDCYWMSLADIQDERLAVLMIAVANSSLATRYYDHVCGNKLYSGRRRWISQYVAKLPVPDPTTQVAEEIVRATQSFLSRGGQPSAAESRELDVLVAKAFSETTGGRADALF